MKFRGTLAPLAVCAVRDAVLYHERLLQSATLRNRADYEEDAVDLSVFLDEIKHQYKKIEAGIGLPLPDFLTQPFQYRSIAATVVTDLMLQRS